LTERKRGGKQVTQVGIRGRGKHLFIRKGGFRWGEKISDFHRKERGKYQKGKRCVFFGDMGKRRKLIRKYIGAGGGGGGAM